MNLNEFQNDGREIVNNNIVDPNLMRRSQGTQGISNSAGQRRIVTPQEMGFTHEEKVIPKRPEDSILDRADIAIARKQREAMLMAEAIEESDGEGISEEEFQDLLVQARDEINNDDGIPTENELNNQIPKSNITAMPVENPAQNLMDE